MYVKAVGPWTKGLRAKAKGVEEAAMDLRESAQQENGNEQLLVVDVDGFYSHVDSFNSMMAAGSSRLLVIAGGSGVTSFLGFIQVLFTRRAIFYCSCVTDTRSIRTLV